MSPVPPRLDRSRFQHYPRIPLLEMKPWPFPVFLDNPNCRWLQTLKRLYAMPISFPASISPQAGLFLHSLTLNIQPRLVIETGTFIGISTIWIGAALAELNNGGVLHSFDDLGPIERGPWRDAEMRCGRPVFVRKNLEDAGISSIVTLYPGQTQDTLPHHLPTIPGLKTGSGGTGGGCQFAFIDADHSIEGVEREFRAIEPYIDVGGYLAFHDTFPEQSAQEGPRVLLDHLSERATGRYDQVDIYLAPLNYGITILQRVG